jgi:anaphase-promoting complex subunit 10
MHCVLVARVTEHCDDGAGVDLLVDGRDDTYWQSDGSQPHLITLQFQQKIRVSRIALQADYRMDESYTPQRVALCIGTRWSDMKVLRTDEVHEPQGWIMIPLMKSSVTNLDEPPREWCECLFLCDGS